MGRFKNWIASATAPHHGFRDPADPLKFVIVTSKLLTGFDAPILQAMYARDDADARGGLASAH